MAINWECNITNVNVTNKRADVSFTRTDDTTQDSWSINFNNAIIETAQQRSDLLDLAWSKWQEELSGRTAIDNFITNLEQLAKSNLESRET